MHVGATLAVAREGRGMRFFAALRMTGTRGMCPYGGDGNAAAEAEAYLHYPVTGATMLKNNGGGIWRMNVLHPLRLAAKHMNWF